MKLSIYSIFDTKAQKYSTPFFQQNDLIALRAFSRGVNDPQSDLNAYSEDFTLYCLGIFDDQTATVEVQSPPQLISTALTVKGQ